MLADISEILITTHLVKTMDLGINGNLYGGRMLDWLDEAGALFVHTRFEGCFVTWKVGETIFHIPVKESSIIRFFVRNITVRHSSVGFEVVARVDETEVLTTSMVFVCVDAQTGKKTAIPGEKHLKKISSELP